MKEFLQIPSHENGFPDNIEGIENHPMNDPDQFKEKVIELGQARQDIKAKKESGEISADQADKLMEELTSEFTS